MGLTGKLGLMCLAQEHIAMTPERLEPAAPRSRVKHSTTEPLRSERHKCVPISVDIYHFKQL